MNKETFWNEKRRNRAEIAIIVVASALILMLGFQAVESWKAHNRLVDQLTGWVVQQQQLQMEAAQRQGLVPPQEAPREDSSAGEGVGGSAPPRN